MRSRKKKASVDPLGIKPRHRGQGTLATAAFGSLFIIFLILVFCFGPGTLPNYKHVILALISALTAGLFGFFLTGSITLRVRGDLHRWGDWVVEAAGGAALFLVVLLFWHSSLSPIKPDKGSPPAGSAADALSLQVLAMVRETAKRARHLQVELCLGEQEGGPSQKALVRAARRVAEAAAAGEQQAGKAVDHLRSTGDSERLLRFLVREREKSSENVLKLNHEIAAVAHATGRIDEAQAVLRAILAVYPNDVVALNRMGQIHLVRSRLDDAAAAFERVREIADTSGNKVAVAAAYSNLGIVLQKRGDFRRAEEMHRSALEMGEELGNLEVVASNYHSLGILHRIRGDLDLAEHTLSQALLIRKLGRQGVAAPIYGELGLIYRIRGDLDGAEAFHRRALQIEEGLGSQEGIAAQYGNLGIIYRKRGELDRAEEMVRKSLEINEKLGRQEGMANQYGNLGNIYQTRGDLDRAEEMFRKALQVANTCGFEETRATCYANLGLVYQDRGDLDRAEEMQKKSLEIDEKLGIQEGIAGSYGNLGLIYKARGDLAQAEEMYRKSLAICKKLGFQEAMAGQYGNLGSIRKQRGDAAGARELWTKSRDIYARIGIDHMRDKVQGWIDDLPGPE